MYIKLCILSKLIKHSRHDLRPVATADTENPEGQTEGEGTTAEGGELPPPLAAEGENATAENASVEGSNRRRTHASRLLDLHRLRHAPADERIAALRQLREQSQTEAEPADTEEPSRRARLTGRLRDTFRIRTRTQDTPPAAAE